MERGYHVAIVGATGAVGQELLSLLDERKFPVARLSLLASKRSAGRKLSYAGEEFPVRELTENSFADVDYALFSVSSAISKALGPVAARAGAVVIDDSSAFRMDPHVPLVVTEVNPHALRCHQGIIAHPNCSTIPLVMVLKPLHERVRVKRVVAATYQSVSGAGARAMQELDQQTRALMANEAIGVSIFPHQIAFNCVPHIDSFRELGYTGEEWKMVRETHKILEDDSIRMTTTTVRVPVFRCHSEAVNIETEHKVSVAEVRQLLAAAPGVAVIDDPEKSQYPMPITVAGRDEVFVGRIRQDLSHDHAVNLWLVSDNLRKGAALNMIQIMELLCAETGR
ncbi:MAG TPA: aspartate-semialdehyde dehydrogenase [Candidatus Tectomicrobia bacterium]|nr:aspartate-semialdehyde dehydrogenase [Candidatus Tectomicrobia bacterium]